MAAQQGLAGAAAAGQGLGAAAAQQQQQQQGLVDSTTRPYGHLTPNPNPPAPKPQERNISRALAHLTNLAVLDVRRVPTLISSSTPGSDGNSGGSSSYSSSSSDTYGAMLPDALGSLCALTSLSAQLWFRDTQLPGAWGGWATSLVCMEVSSRLRLGLGIVCQGSRPKG
jgi:hypothetical protein